jgi:hypothetical protein
MRSKLSMVVLALSLLATAATSAFAAQGWLGVTTQSTDSDSPREGLFVSSVSSGSPADRAGLERGDIILSWDGRSVTEPDELRRLVRNTQPGERATLHIWRDGSRRALEVRVGELPGTERDEFDTPVPSPPDPPSAPRAPRAPGAPHDEDDGTVHRRMIVDGKELTEEEMDEKMKELKKDGLFDEKEMKDLKELKELKDVPGIRGWTGDDGRTFTFFDNDNRGRLGVRVERLTDDLAQALGVEGDEGVMVVQVIEDTPAQRAGLRAGDVIVRVEGTSVSDPDELVRALRDQNGAVDIVVLRKGVRRTIQATLDRNTSPRARTFTPAPNARRFERRIPELNRNPQVYRWRARDEARNNEDLREELRQLRRELEELRRELGERR